MKTYNWGILGTGYIARKMAEALSYVSQARLYAIGSRNKQTALEFASTYKTEKVYGSYEELVADPDVDIVYVATPHNLHYENTMMSLNHGKHVLCEKPFAVNGYQVRRMIEKARENNLFLMEALWTRFLPHLIRAKELVDKGLTGKIRLIKADFGINVPFNPLHRLYNKKLSGGSLLDLGIYPVFFTLLFLGKPEKITAIAGIGSTDVDYNCSMTFGYRDETLAVMYSSILAQTDISAAVYGEKGSIVFDNWWYMPVQIKFITAEGKIIPEPVKFEGNGYNYEAAEVIRCLNEGKTQSSLMSWDDSLLLIDTLDEIRKEIRLVYPEHDI
jgi:predicted dehydrogenase